MKPSEALSFSRPLWRHQADFLDRFAYENEAALLHDMGVGKTTSAIALCRAKYNVAKAVLPTLIVAPIATLDNWLEEIKRNAPEKVSNSAVVVRGTTPQKFRHLSNAAAKIFIINPEMLDTGEIASALVNKKFSIVIVDESHRFKNYKSKRLDRLLFLTDAALTRIILTGTPILNSYLDIWAQWRILDKGKTFGMSYFAFRARYFRDENAGMLLRKDTAIKHYPSYAPLPGIDAVLAQMMDRNASRIEKSACLSLPPFVQMTEYVPMGDEQERLYRSMESELIAEVASGTCAAMNALSRVLRLLQIISGHLPVETIENQKFTHRIKENPRLARLTELLTELTPKHKVIVWANFQENYGAIRAACEELGIELAELTGQTKNRQEEIDRFNKDPKCRVFISNPKAGGTGVNLISASYSICYSYDFSLGDWLQAEARNYRGGSEIHEKITKIVLLAKGTIQENVLEALQRKENFSDNVLDRLTKLR